MLISHTLLTNKNTDFNEKLSQIFSGLDIFFLLIDDYT